MTAPEKNGPKEMCLFTSQNMSNPCKIYRALFAFVLSHCKNVSSPCVLHCEHVSPLSPLLAVSPIYICGSPLSPTKLAHLYIYIHMYIYIYMCIYVHIYTYICRYIEICGHEILGPAVAWPSAGRSSRDSRGTASTAARARSASAGRKSRRKTLPPTNMEVQKGPSQEESSPSTGVCALPC